jgi:hypothetical protein
VFLGWNAGNGDTEVRGVGEVRQRLLTRRMVLPEDHLPLRSVRRLPMPHPSFQRAAKIVAKLRVPALHLVQHRDRPQSRCALQRRNNLAVPIRFQGVGTPSTPRLALLRGHPRIGIQPGTRGGAETGLRRRRLAAVSSSEGHVQLRLLIGDVMSRHAEVSLLGG